MASLSSVQANHRQVLKRSDGARQRELSAWVTYPEVPSRVLQSEYLATDQSLSELRTQRTFQEMPFFGRTGLELLRLDSPMQLPSQAMV
jgi:hypothetical protein